MAAGFSDGRPPPVVKQSRPGPPRAVWLGGLLAGGAWSWHGGAALEYTHWAAPEGLRADPNQPYLCYSVQDRLWHDCNGFPAETLPVLCESRGAPQGEGCILSVSDDNASVWRSFTTIT
jgi:hypothetical protein